MPEQKTDAGLQSILAALAGGGAPQGNIADILPLLQGIPAQQEALQAQSPGVAALASPSAPLAAGVSPQPQIPIEVLLQILGQLGLQGGAGGLPGALPGAPPQFPIGPPGVPQLPGGVPSVPAL